MEKLRAFTVDERRRIQQATEGFENATDEQLQQLDRAWRASKADRVAYVAQVSASGTLAAASGTTPGSATCDLYRLKNDPIEIAAVLDENDAQRTVTVYNFSDSEIAAGEYFAIVRDVGGKWIALAGGGGVSAANPCGCDFVTDGTVSCLGTNDSADVYIVDDLGPLGTNVELTFDAACEWISDNIDYSC